MLLTKMEVEQKDGNENEPLNLQLLGMGVLEIVGSLPLIVETKILKEIRW